MREHSTGVSQERHASSVSGAAEQGACCSARCGCLGAVGLTDCPRTPLPWALYGGCPESRCACAHRLALFLARGPYSAASVRGAVEL